MAYRMHDVTILAEDCDKAKAILDKHEMADHIVEMYTDEIVTKVDGKNVKILSYWIAPFICEDFETIVAEFKQAGIRIV